MSDVVDDTLLLGDVIDRSADLTPKSIRCVVTSPPYAMQRADQYGGVPEDEYPAWTVRWMAALRPALTDDANVFINIRPHVSGGQVSDYVLRTRLALRASGWIECDELIWCKNVAPPLGDNSRPRRAWESVLWFAPQPRPYCDRTANGRTTSHRLFMGGGAGQRNGWVNKPTTPDDTTGGSSSTDVVHIEPSRKRSPFDHPAPYPIALAEWFIRQGSEPGDLICDPFMGSGTTAIAAIRNHRRWIGIERDPEYAQKSLQRIAAEPPPLQLEDEPDPPAQPVALAFDDGFWGDA